jgi:hypothetical protein
MEHQALESIEFSDKPSVLVFAQGEIARERAERSVELAGCRVSHTAGIAGSQERLGRQACVDTVFVEVEEDAGEELDRLLEALDRAAAAGSHGSVVSAPAALIDVVAAKAFHPRVIHLCNADEQQRVAAIARATARWRHMLHDIGKEQEPSELQQLSEEVGKIANILASLSEREAAQAAGDEKGQRSLDAGQVRAIIRARRLRDQYFGNELFADPAWDILLDLFAARLEKRSVAVSSLCIAAAVPPTTALRWIKTLTDLGLLVRTADPQDGRRVYIELAPKAAEGVEACLKAALRVSPLII